MGEFGVLLLGLMVAVAALSALATVLGVPYPIVLVVGGLALGTIPGLPDTTLDPDIVLVLFLPPLLYSSAFFVSLRDLKADLRAISMLAVGLVIATMGAVAYVAHALIDGMPWSAAFTLGAIVAPTDALAAGVIATRLGVPRRVMTILEGESLINDGTALVAYRVAVAAVVSGSFSLVEVGPRFVLSVAGGIVIGLVVGWLIAEVRRRLDDPPVEVTISLATGYAAYLPAEALGVSGVLAAVTAGTYVGWHAPSIASPTQRLGGYAVWENLTFLLNAILFVLVGLQLPVVLDGLSGIPTGTLLGYAAAVSATVIVVRLIWQSTTPYVIRALDRRPSQRARRAGWRPRLIVGWAGMRGAVSLAAALALPNVTDAGGAFPQRDLIVFLTFAVILATLVLQGLTLPALIKALHVHDDGSEQREEVHARLAAVDAALARLDELALEEWTREDTIDRVRRAYLYRQRRFTARRDGDDSDGYEERSIAYQRLMRELFDVQRAELASLRNRGVISNEVMHRIERELDLEDTRLEI
jgi:monovalent cation/hydrogen antiporter